MPALQSFRRRHALPQHHFSPGHKKIALKGDLLGRQEPETESSERSGDTESVVRREWSRRGLFSQSERAAPGVHDVIAVTIRGNGSRPSVAGSQK